MQRLPHELKLREVWRSMLARCYNDKLPSWPNYGGRGIKVCDRWRNSFECFYFDVAAEYEDGLQIDRFPDNDGNYAPGNTRWATRVEQLNNTRATKRIKIAGKTFSMSELAKEIGAEPKALRRVLGPRRRRLGGRKDGRKDVIPLPLSGHVWPQTDEQRVYERVVAQHNDGIAINVSAIARGLNIDRKHAERVLLRLRKLGLVEIRIPSEANSESTRGAA